jgi:hypothetical protein
MKRIKSGHYTGVCINIEPTGTVPNGRRAYTLKLENGSWYLVWDDNPQGSIRAPKRKDLINYLQRLSTGEMVA